MRFEMTKAWDDAIVLLRGNRELVAIVAGVFFLLPSLALTVLLADQQAQAMAMFEAMLAGDAPPTDLSTLVGGDVGLWFGAGLASFVVQLIGYMALLALMDARHKPTVGQAIGQAFRSILPLIGAVLLFYLGMIVVLLGAVLVLALLIGLLVAAFAAIGGESAGAVVGAILFFFLYVGAFFGLFYLMVRLSLVLPVIVLGRVANPVRAYKNSWSLTRGNGWRLFGFYALLMIAYFVISLLVLGLLMGLGAIVASGMTVALLAGAGSALISAAVSIVFTAVLAAIYEQLRQGAPEAAAETFE